MATLTELWTIMNDAMAGDRATATGDQLAAIQLLDKIEAAIWIRINAIMETTVSSEDASAREHLGWAKQAASSSRGTAQVALRILVADSAALTTAQILGANDAAIQAKLDAVVPQLARGMDMTR